MAEECPVKRVDNPVSQRQFTWCHEGEKVGEKNEMSVGCEPGEGRKLVHEWTEMSFPLLQS